MPHSEKSVTVFQLCLGGGNWRGLVDVIGAGMSAQTHQGLVCMEET